MADFLEIRQNCQQLDSMRHVDMKIAMLLWYERERLTSSPTFLGGNTPATLG